MSAASMSEMPSLSASGDDGEFSRISKTAVVSTALGVLSVGALITMAMIPVSVIAAILGLVAAWRIARDSSLSGTTFARIGIALGVLTACWAITSQQLRTNYLYNVAGQHAKSFLQILAAGDTYTALELTKTEAERQITGTNLEAHYAGSESESAVLMRKFLSTDSTKVIMESGPNSNWEFVSGAGVSDASLVSDVTVKMKDVSKNDGQVVFVRLRRTLGMLVEDEGQETALWNVEKTLLPNE